MATPRKGPKTVTAAHKAAMATGRAESRTATAYLEALAAHAPRRGRRRTPESIHRRLAAITVELDQADMLTRLLLIQERFNLEAELERITNADDNFRELEAAFVEIAASYTNRKGITHTAWRHVGVPTDVLHRAGISR